MGVVLVSDKLDFRPKLIRRGKKLHFVVIKGTVNLKETTVLNIYAPNAGIPNFIKIIPKDFKR